MILWAVLHPLTLIAILRGFKADILMGQMSFLCPTNSIKTLIPGIHWLNHNQKKFSISSKQHTLMHARGRYPGKLWVCWLPPFFSFFWSSLSWAC